MRMFRVPGRKTVIATVGAVVALGAGGTAYAATSSPPAPAGSAAPPPQAPATGTHRHRPLTLLQRADHATVELKVKGQWVTYTVDRGKVTAVSPTSITLLRPDGQSVTETITPATKFGGVSGENQVRTGRRAMVVSDNGSALRIRQHP